MCIMEWISYFWCNPKREMKFLWGLKWAQRERYYCSKFNNATVLLVFVIGVVSLHDSEIIIRHRWMKADFIWILEKQQIIYICQVRTLVATCCWLTEKCICQFINAWGRDQNSEGNLMHQNKVDGKHSFKQRCKIFLTTSGPFYPLMLLFTGKHPWSSKFRAQSQGSTPISVQSKCITKCTNVFSYLDTTVNIAFMGQLYCESSRSALCTVNLHSINWSGKLPAHLMFQ